jgi:hypothetical protein
MSGLIDSGRGVANDGVEATRALIVSLAPKTVEPDFGAIFPKLSWRREILVQHARNLFNAAQPAIASGVIRNRKASD